jgi:hypothetical protein
MKLDTEKAPTEDSIRLLSYVPKTALGKSLLAIRAEIVATGEPLLNRDEVEKEVANRRGERRD